MDYAFAYAAGVVTAPFVKWAWAKYKASKTTTTTTSTTAPTQ